MSLDRVLRGGVWLSIGSILTSFFGFVYWLLVSPLVSPEVVGRVATVLAIEGLLLSTLSFGIPTGVMRLLGREFGRRDSIELGRYFYSPLIFLFVIDVASALIFLVLGLFVGVVPLDPDSVFFTSLLMLIGMNGWPFVVISFFSSILRTEYVALANLITGLGRLVIGISLVYLGLGFYGIMLGYVSAALVSDAMLLLLASRQLRRLRVEFSTSLRAVRESLEAGLATWIPSILTLMGQWLGVLGLRGLVGSYETGTYFIAFAITTGILALPMNVLTLSFPVLSSMEDGRKRFMVRAARLASAMTFPLAFTLIAYPALIPSLLGQSYIPASAPIMILSAGFLLAPIVNSYTIYAYAAGRYGEVTAIGVAGNAARLALYLTLIQTLAEEGAAASFALGFIPSLLLVIHLSKKARYQLGLKDNLITLLIPLCAYLVILLLKLLPILGIPLILIPSYILYARLRIITREDLKELSTALISEKALAALSPFLRPILRILYGD